VKSAGLKYILIFILSAELLFSQEIQTKREKVAVRYKDKITDAVIAKSENYNSSKSEEYRIRIIEKIKFRNFSNEKNERTKVDIVSSFGNNISFGGFWENYAVINFTPQISIQPAEFISIYANHYLNCLIPLSSLKEYSGSVILQGIAILSVDQSMKLFLQKESSWISEIIAFAAKNLLLNLIIKSSINNNSNSNSPSLQFENYYYSMSIEF